MADETREFIPKDAGDRMLVFDLASEGDAAGAAPPRSPPRAETPLPLEREPRRRGSRRLLWGVVGAVALGGVLGVVARPELVGEPVKMQPARPPAEAAALPQVQVMVRDEPQAAPAATPAPSPQPASDGQLAAVPQQAAPAQPAPPAAAPRPAAPAQVAVAPARPAATPRVEPPAPATRALARAEPPAPRARPSFDCRYARSRSEEMVCSDPQLAAADRRLARAYDRAVAAGVPSRYLRAEQDDWLAIREEAARRSPGAVADIYEQRTAELNDMAIEAQDGF